MTVSPFLLVHFRPSSIWRSDMISGRAYRFLCQKAEETSWPCETTWMCSPSSMRTSRGDPLTSITPTSLQSWKQRDGGVLSAFLRKSHGRSLHSFGDFLKLWKTYQAICSDILFSFSLVYWSYFFVCISLNLSFYFLFKWRWTAEYMKMWSNLCSCHMRNMMKRDSYCEPTGFPWTDRPHLV